MEKRTWNPAPEQSENIEDQEKAIMMAEVMNSAHDLANAYAEYLEDPHAWEKKYDATWDNFGWHPRQYANSFRNLKENDIKPEDLLKDGETDAEARAAVFDYEKSLSEKSPAELKAERIMLKAQIKFYDIVRAYKWSGKSYGPFDPLRELPETQDFRDLSYRLTIAQEKYAANLRESESRHEKMAA